MGPLGSLYFLPLVGEQSVQPLELVLPKLRGVLKSGRRDTHKMAKKCPTMRGIVRMKSISGMNNKEATKEFIRVQRIIGRCPVMEQRNRQLKKRLHIPLDN